MEEKVLIFQPDEASLYLNTVPWWSKTLQLAAIALHPPNADWRRSLRVKMHGRLHFYIKVQQQKQGRRLLSHPPEGVDEHPAGCVHSHPHVSGKVARSLKIMFIQSGSPQQDAVCVHFKPTKRWTAASIFNINKQEKSFLRWTTRETFLPSCYFLITERACLSPSRAPVANVFCGWH